MGGAPAVVSLRNVCGNVGFAFIILRFGTALDNIKKELAIWKKLDHENVVVLFEVIDDPEKDKLYMISELVDGGPVMKDHG